MYLLKLLFSENGRISRLEYFCGVLLLYFIVALLWVGSSYLFHESNSGLFIFFIIISILLYFYCGMTMATKRLRDAVKPSWLVCFIFIPLIDTVLKLYLILVPGKATIDTPELKREPPKFSLEYSNLHIRPWHRLFARLIDVYLIVFIISVIVAGFYPSLGANSPIQNVLIGLISIFFWALLEPIFLACCGFTLGKYIFNITIRDLNNQKLKFQSALIRSFTVWLKGYACGIPVVSLFTFATAYTRLINTGTTSWDEHKFVITHNKIGVVRCCVIALFFIMYVSLVMLGRLAKS